MTPATHNGLTVPLAMHLIDAQPNMQRLVENLALDGDVPSLHALLTAFQTPPNKPRAIQWGTSEHVMPWLADPNPERKALANAWADAIGLTPEKALGEVSKRIKANTIPSAVIDGLTERVGPWLRQQKKPWKSAIAEPLHETLARLFINNSDRQTISFENDVKSFQKWLSMDPEGLANLTVPSENRVSWFQGQCQFPADQSITTLGALLQMGMPDSSSWIDVMKGVYGENRVRDMAAETVRQFVAKGVPFQFKSWGRDPAVLDLLDNESALTLALSPCHIPGASQALQGHPMPTWAAVFHEFNNPDFSEGQLRRWLDKGIDVNQRMVWRNTPTLTYDFTALHVAVLQKSPNALQALLLNGADINATRKATVAPKFQETEPTTTELTAEGILIKEKMPQLGGNLAILQAHKARHFTNDLLRQIAGAPTP